MNTYKTKAMLLTKEFSTPIYQYCQANSTDEAFSILDNQLYQQYPIDYVGIDYIEQVI